MEVKKIAPKITGGKKGKEVPQALEEEELSRLKEEFEANNKTIEAYTLKINKLPDVKAKYSELLKTEGVIIDLLDSAGERKFLNLKRDHMVNEFLGDKSIYHLVQIKPSIVPEGNHSLFR